MRRSKHFVLLFVAFNLLAANVTADVLVCVYNNSSILRFDDDGNYINDFVSSGSSPLNGPYGIELGPDGNYYVSSRNNGGVFRFANPSGEFLGEFIPPGTLTSPRDLQFGPDGDLYVAVTGALKQFNGVTGQYVRDAYVLGDKIGAVINMRFEPLTDNLLMTIVDDSIFTIVRIEIDFTNQGPSNVVYTIDFAPLHAGGLRSFAFGPGAGPEGDLFVPIHDGVVDENRVERFDLASGDYIGTFAFDTPGPSFSDLEFAPDGDLLIGTPQGEPNEIERYDGATGMFSGIFIAGLPGTTYDFDFVPGLTTSEAVATNLHVIRGIQIGGDLSNTYQSDDTDLHFRPGITLNSSEPPVWLEFESTLPNVDPESFSFTLEANLNTPNILQSIELFNYSTGQYELVDSRLATLNDSVVFIEADGDLPRFIESGTGNVKSRIAWKAVGFLTLFPWTVSIDHILWTETF